MGIFLTIMLIIFLSEIVFNYTQENEIWVVLFEKWLYYKQVDKNVQKSIWILSKIEHFGGA